MTHVRLLVAAQKIRYKLMMAKTDRFVDLWLTEVRNQTGCETGFRVTDRADRDGREGVGLSSCCLVHFDRSIPGHLAEVSWI